MSTTDHTRPHEGHHPAGGHGADTQLFDREINIRGIVLTTAGLVAVTLVAAGLMWLLLQGLDRYQERRDPEPLPFPEANQPRVPPAPRLQVSPGFGISTPEEPETQGPPPAQSDKEDMEDLREQEDQILQGSRWVNQRSGTLQVPVEVALDVIAQRGLAPQVVGGNPADAAGSGPATGTAPAPAGVADTAGAIQATGDRGGAPQANPNQAAGAQATPSQRLGANQAAPNPSSNQSASGQEDRRPPVPGFER